MLIYIFKMHKTGMNVDYVLVLFKVASLSQSFCAKSFSTQYMAVTRFMKRHSYTYRLGTQVSQHLPEEVADEVRA